jgi:hypothetical protein
LQRRVSHCRSSCGQETWPSHFGSLHGLL